MAKYLVLIVVALACLSCTKEEPAAWDGPRLTQPRDQLTVEQLQADKRPTLLDMSYLARPAWADAAAHPFSGSISFGDTEMTYPLEREHYASEALFPAVTLDLLSHDGELIPLEKRLIATWQSSDSLWDLFVGTGAVWQEAGDGGWSRASFPLSLVDRFIGQVRNCVATFVYNDDSMSNVYVQCSQETADMQDGRLGDIQVLLEAKLEPKRLNDSARIIAAHEQLESSRLPVHPLEEIDTSGTIAAYFEKPLRTHAPTSLGAILVDGQLYIHPPKTRHGLYPYPTEMRHGVYSVTKSMAGALALFYLAERYDPEILDALITDYVPALADHPGWQGVTFAHALNMATGTEGSEAAEHLLETLILADDADTAIKNVASLGDYPEAPGETFNYASTNFFVLSYAMQRYVEAQEGDGVNYWALVHENVLVPIGAAHFTVQHTVERDGSPGIPWLAYGAFPTLDEAAKIARLFVDEGSSEGRQLLNRDAVRMALGHSEWAGYRTGERGVTYRHSFWARTIQTDRCRVDVTYMQGHGANHVLFLPSDVVVIRFMDEDDYNLDELVRGVEAVVPSC